jgi:hypothetical protein
MLVIFVNADVKKPATGGFFVQHGCFEVITFWQRWQLVWRHQLLHLA